MGEELPPGLAARYTGLQELGSGAFGKVLRAQDSTLGRPVALKILNPFRAADPEARARFEREAALFSRLNSPHLPRVYDFGVVDGIPHIVFELLTGESLSRRLQQAGGRLPPEQVRELVDQLLDGLDSLHQAQILHRDLKPDNILLLESGRLALIDLGLGLAPDSEPLTKTGVAVGTPAYLAPDLMSGGRWSESSDLYALALIGLQALWGKLPLAAPTMLETLEVRRAGPVPWLAKERLALEPPWTRALVAALDPEPGRRPRTVAALRALLAAPDQASVTRSGDPLSASSGRPRSRTASVPRVRPRTWAAGWAVGVIATLGLGAAALHLAGVQGPAGSGSPDRGAAAFRALAAFRTELDRDPAIAAALDLTSEIPDPDARSEWHRARAAYRRLLEQHGLRETLATVAREAIDRAVADDLGRVLLVESLLGHTSRRETPPLFEGEPPSGIHRAFEAVATLVDVPDLAGTQDPAAPQGLLEIERRLQRDGARFERIYSYRARPDSGRLATRHQPRVRTVDPRGRPHQGWFQGDSTQLVFSMSPFTADNFQNFPFGVGAELPPFPGDLVLVADALGLSRDRPGWLELVGPTSSLGLPLLPAPSPPEYLERDLELHQLFMVRVPRRLLPERPKTLRLSAIALQPLGPSDPLIAVWHLWLQTEGPVPDALAPRR